AAAGAGAAVGFAAAAAGVGAGAASAGFAGATVAGAVVGGGAAAGGAAVGAGCVGAAGPQALSNEAAMAAPPQVCNRARRVQRLVGSLWEPSATSRTGSSSSAPALIGGAVPVAIRRGR